MTNRHLTRPPTEILRARLKVLMDNVNNMYQSGSQVLESDISTAYHDALSLFFESLDNSITSISVDIKQGTPADPLIYNVFTNAFMRDMEALFLEITALDKLTTSSFNSILAEQEQVLQISRRISNKLGDYLLYADPSLGGGFFFGDSFNSAERIEVGTPLLEGNECFLGQDEGVILLPLDDTPERPTVKSFIINKLSNGTAGNNLQIDTISKTEMAAIGDGEPNTWYEYEKVTTFESSTPLIFDFTIALEEISIINHIHINPINFGTPTPVKIIKLETSKDGLEYISIKDEVPIKDFVAEDKEDVFSLSPATSKFAGQGFYSFLPRKMQFVHVVLEQHTPYSIQTNNGLRLRYAIGIRDINILGRKFKPDGSIISTPFSSNIEIKKVSLWASENPTEASQLADIIHSISENDGATWRPVQPQGRSSFDLPEVINFNNIASGSVTTDSPVDTLRHKVTMKRNTDVFDGDIILKQEKISQVDIVSAPSGGDFTIQTTQSPVEETLILLAPFYGSYSCPAPRYGSNIVGKSAPMDLDFMDFNVDVPSIDTLRFDLPLLDIENLEEHLRVLVNGEQIEFVDKDAESLGANSYTSYSPVDENSKVYFLNKGGRELQFGHVDNSTDPPTKYGFLPPAGAKIQVCLDGDNPRLELTDKGYVLNLTSSSDGFKENMSIVSIDNLTEEEALDTSISIPPGHDRIKVYPRIKNKFVGDIKNDKNLNYPLPIGKPSSYKTAGKLEDISIESSLNHGLYTKPIESYIGALPPVFRAELATWTIEEYDLDGALITGASKQFTEPQTFFNGRMELLNPSTWTPNENAYSFDPVTGIVYLGSNAPADRQTVFKCKVLDYTTVPEDGWEYYRSQVYERISPNKIVLDPKYAITHKKTKSIGETDVPLSPTIKSVSLAPETTKSHDWFKQRLVKGTVIFKSGLFPAGIEPTEVPFIDGNLELQSVVQVEDELVAASSGSGEHSFVLQKIDSTNEILSSPGFAPVRSLTDPSTPDSQFVTLKSATDTLDNPGDWKYVVSTSGVVTVTVLQSGGLNQHYASYRYTADDPGIDAAGQYSIDYSTGNIYFAEKISLSGVINYEVSQYSAFYNIAELVSSGNIEEINTEERSITLKSAYGMQFLKLSSALKARPSFLKIMYEFYKTSTESLRDLEPYFSPICKDVAFRAVTADVLEEL